jgi:hypothetical protein
MGIFMLIEAEGSKRWGLGACQFVATHPQSTDFKAVDVDA